MVLIDKAALLNKIATEVHYDSEHSLEMYAKMLSLINDAPEVEAVPLEDYKSMERTVNKLTKAIAEAEPVKHGHWCVTQAYPHTIYCSECFQRFAQAHWAVWEDGSLPRDYCPNCGAKMDGERREDAETN